MAAKRAPAAAALRGSEHINTSANDAKAQDDVADDDSDGWAEPAEDTAEDAQPVEVETDDNEEAVDFDPEIVEDARSGIEVTAPVPACYILSFA